LRHHLARVVEEATIQSSGDERLANLTVVVAGGGFVGVETAGQLADRLVDLAQRYGRPERLTRVILIKRFQERLRGRLKRVVDRGGREYRRRST
jgi:NADH dehydrogenase FAD-containing subunit